jgi:hypothetical protein
MTLPILSFAIFPTSIGIYLLIRTIHSIKNFNRRYGALSDLNLNPETKKTLFTVMAFWEICQAAYLLLLYNRLALNYFPIVVMIMAALVSSLIGLLCKSRTFFHDVLFFGPGALSLIIMAMMNTGYLPLAIIVIIFIAGAVLAYMRGKHTMKNYWKIEIFILICYALWNAMAAF